MEQRTLADQIGNWLFGKPAVAQLWARWQARRWVAQAGGPIPFAPLRKPLDQCRVALITTGGVHLRDQPPFDMVDPQGDASYRELPGNVAADQITITHTYYNHTDADRDLNVIFPLAHVRDLVARGVVGALAPRHFGLMGHIDGPHVATLIDRTAPEIAAKLGADDVDIAFLTPA